MGDSGQVKVKVKLKIPIPAGKSPWGSKDHGGDNDNGRKKGNPC